MPTSEDITQYIELLATNRRTLSAYLNQHAALGGTGYASPGIVNGIEESRIKIREIKNTLRLWKVEVEDLPYDDDIGGEDSARAVLGEQADPSGGKEAMAKIRPPVDRLRNLAATKKFSLRPKIIKGFLPMS